MMHSKTLVAVPPGETIKEQLAYRGMSQKDFALRMDLSEKHVSNLLNGSVSLTPNVAFRLEMVLGIPAIFWENLEMKYRAALVRINDENNMDEDIEISKNFRYSEIVKLGWLPNVKTHHEKVVALRKFFEVSRLSLLTNNARNISGIACRRLSFTNKGDYALMIWAQKAKLEARKIETDPINISKLETLLPVIREMNNTLPEKFCDELIELLSGVGIALVFLPHINGSFLHGASFYDGKKIVMGLTVRGKDADKFWFSLFHEIAHVIYGHIGQSNGTSESDEKKADAFARETLIPEEALTQFINHNVFTKESLIRFANSINIDVGILIGRLQNDGILQYRQFHYLKTKYTLEKK